MGFRRIAQAVCLALFLGLLLAAAGGAVAGADLFLRLDPGLAAGTGLAARWVGAWALPAALVILSALLAGRVFCGYVCPMGTTIDCGDRLVRGRRKGDRPGRDLSGLKYGLLAFVLGAAALGISLVFLVSPLPLITRFYGLVLQPVAALSGDQILQWVRPLADHFDIRRLMYAEIDTPRFATQLFVLLFFAGVFAAALLTPRFWCRYLCPSGAVLALCSPRPRVGRRVDDSCIQCGKCAEKCPMAAIPQASPEVTRSRECIVCRTCEAVCPVDAIHFGTGRSEVRVEGYAPSLSRRGFLFSGLAGAGTAALSLTGLHAVHGKAAEGQVRPERLIRPPAALPEPAFLSRCVRCGECMVACPTNTLQPIWFAAGFPALFSPAVTPRRGYCDPRCHRCAQVCPTEAIRALPPAQRIRAKTGTAIIYRRKCLAWEHKKSCMVCDEVCPFDAIDFRREPGNPYPVPHVRETRCAGCGYCEHFCPVQNDPAIVVIPMGALRLDHGEYREAARAQGLDLRLKAKAGAEGYPPSGGSAPEFGTGTSEGTAPGFDTGTSEDTAPGFDAGGGGYPAYSGDGAGPSDLAPGFDAGGGGSPKE